uniref:Alpha-ketoglutarate-dependent dioxygenase AlkB-like domain-containing protein n=1 Tax=Corethron hystrix TaxID=216773 RepID=A0A7S1FL10_9STRA|mmetsp:Transcript_12923/g.28557  ORF Transcript_12923/g.28557 Transcript_12923/m.28557 type:complete len:335 (+) Transcript_12923:109-1113(+)
MERSNFFIAKKPAAKRARLASHEALQNNKSRFVSCPLCLKSFPIHFIEAHAAACDGASNVGKPRSLENKNSAGCSFLLKDKTSIIKASKGNDGSSVINLTENTKALKQSAVKMQWRKIIQSAKSNSSVPGLFLFEDFITEEEEKEIIRHLDGVECTKNTNNDNKSHDEQPQFLPWKPCRFNGQHRGKRWGVHCSLRDRKVYPAERPLPAPIRNIIKKMKNHPRLKYSIMRRCTPNEANAIDYRRERGDHLQSHVDDRQLSKELIVNLSLAGDCLMTFRHQRTRTVASKKVLLKRRTLQVLTGGARYDYSHGICNEDLLSDRRISITMRESPLTK